MPLRLLARLDLGLEDRSALLRHRGARLAEDPAQLVALDYLDGEQARGDLAERVAVGADQVARAVHRLVQQAADLGVDLALHALAIDALRDAAQPVRSGQERRAAALGERHRTDRVGHAILGDHHAGDLGRLPQLVRGAGGDDPTMISSAARPPSRPASLSY